MWALLATFSSRHSNENSNRSLNWEIREQSETNKTKFELCASLAHEIYEGPT